MSGHRLSRRVIRQLCGLQSSCNTRRYVLQGRPEFRRGLASVSQEVIFPQEKSGRPEDLKEPKMGNEGIQVFSDVRDGYVDVPAVWLRDHCRCSKCFHEITKQRLIETFDEIPSDVKIAKGGIVDSGNAIKVTWADGHESNYSKTWLSDSGLKKNPRSAERQAMTETRFWTGKSIKKNPPSVSYEAIMSSDEGLKAWLTNIRQYGFSYVNDCPVTPEASEKLLLRIAYIRNTHYGGFYDFTADLSSGDTAYTQLGIGAHNDNTYFSDAAGLQMFHLLSHTDGTGGASQLVDGFGAASELLRRHPAAYEILSSVRVHSHASGGDISIQSWSAQPVLVHDPQAGFLSKVRWNTTDRAAIDAPLESMGSWYDAARKWAALLREMEYWEQMVPGRPLIFDNWRVLHGRSAFTGNRRICGGYVNRDDWISRFKLVNLGKEKCLQQVTRG